MVRAPEPELIRDSLSGAAIARNILVVGDRVHVFVDDAIRRLPELRAYLDRKGISYESAEQVAPSIADLFVSAVEGDAAHVPVQMP